MGIATRFVQLVKADLHGVMDHMEDKGLMLRQCLRDMEDQIMEAREELGRLEAGRDRALEEHVRVDAELAALEKDLTLALSNGRDDIARTLIKKLKLRERHRDELDRQLSSMQKDMAQHGENLAEMEREYDRISMEADIFLGEMESRKASEARRGAERIMGTAEPAEEEIELELMRRKEQLAQAGKEKTS